MKNRDVKNNALLLISARFFNIAVNFIFLFLLAYKLDITGIGLYGVAYSMFQLTAQLSAMGTHRYGVREIIHDRGREKRILENILCIRMGAAFAAFGLTAVYVRYTQDSGYHTVVMLIMCMAVVFEAVEGTLDILFVAYERFTLQIIPRVLFVFIYAVTGCLIIFTGRSLVYLALLFAATAFLRMLLKIYIASAVFFTPRLKIRTRELYELAVKLIPFAISFGLGFLYLKADMVIVENILGKDPSGLYFMGAVIIMFPFQVFVLSVGAIYPRLSALYIQKEGDFQRYSGVIRFQLTSVAVIMAVVLFFGSSVITGLIYPGKDTASVEAVIKILAFFIPLNVFSMVNEMRLQISGREWKVAAILGANGILNIVLTILLVPRFGIEGAAAATLAAIAIRAIHTGRWSAGRPDWKIDCHKP